MPLVYVQGAIMIMIVAIMLHHINHQKKEYGLKAGHSIVIVLLNLMIINLTEVPWVRPAHLIMIGMFGYVAVGCGIGMIEEIVKERRAKTKPKGEYFILD